MSLYTLYKRQSTSKRLFRVFNHLKLTRLRLILFEIFSVYKTIINSSKILILSSKLVLRLFKGLKAVLLFLKFQTLPLPSFRLVVDVFFYTFNSNFK